jgi:hypothetical protein
MTLTHVIRFVADSAVKYHRDVLGIPLLFPISRLE